jgi:hypothetical protein
MGDNPIHRGAVILGASGAFDRYWNPLTDDGDALRLAVQLKRRVSVCVDHTNVDWWADADTLLDICQNAGDDPCAATRRAIVRAAAAIGAKHG